MISGIVFFYLSLIFSSSTQAMEEVCFTDGDQFEKIKMILPAHFQNPPLVFTRDVRDTLVPVTAAVKILITDEKKLKLVAHTWTSFNIESEELYIAEICYKEPEFTVKLDNGESYNIETNSKNKSVEISNLEFQKSSESVFAGIIEKIKQEQKQNSSNKEHSSSR